jgi:hypothetical protein
MKKQLIFLFAILLLLGLFKLSYAKLIDRGGGLIYDTVQDITWLQDANYAKTSGYDEEGRMSWDEAMAWADQLVYGGFDDWRLPTTIDGPSVWGYDGTTTAGFNISTSEMGYMFYENLGNLGTFATDGTNPQTGWGLNNTGPFYNLVPWYYWSGTEYGLDPSIAWFFHFDNGRQRQVTKDTETGFYAWAVHPGDIGKGNGKGNGKGKNENLYPINLPQTGWVSSDSHIDRDDGDLQMGVKFPDPRFTDNGDGTVTDNLTNLVWLKNADCFGEIYWYGALAESNNLESGYCDLSDDSQAGDWRLPNRNELLSLIDISNFGNNLALPDGHPFINAREGFYWTSTTAAFNRPAEAWYLYTYNGSTDYEAKSSINFVWPVRGPE